MQKFYEMQAMSGKFREKNDCVVKALAITAEIAYEKAHAILKQFGRKDRHGTYHHVSRTAFRSVRPFCEEMKIRKENGSMYTSRTLPAALPKGHYVVFFRGHAAAMVDGVIEDWSAGKCKRVQRVVKMK